MARHRKQRVIAYIDGFNLYYGLRAKGWKRFYWLDVHEMCRRLLRAEQELVLVKYFTSRISRPEDKRLRQNAFCEATENTPGVRVYYGRYKYWSLACPSCGRKNGLPTEKRTDVNVAVEMLSDAYDGKFDVALLVSGDTDFVPLIQAAHRTSPRKRVVVCFPPERWNRELADAASAYLTIGRGVIADSQFPPVVTRSDGHPICRPAEWSDERAQAKREARAARKGKRSGPQGSDEAQP